MSLITIDRSLLASSNDNVDALQHVEHSNCSSKSSQSEDFLMCKATAVGLNVRSRRRSSCIKPNDEIQDHLKKILELLRFGDYVQLVVRLQSEFPRQHHHRYCCVISTTGKLGTEESAVLGVDLAYRRATIGLILPIWQDMLVKLYGDGGFELITKDTVKQFKPVSVQALWAAFQAVNRACQVARINDYYSRGLTHDWVAYYHSLPASDTYQIQEWLKTDDIDEFNRYTPSNLCLTSSATEEEKERARMETLLRNKLEEIMYVVDLEEVTVLQLRQRLEEDLGVTLHDFRHFIEKEVLTIFGRMDEASVIFDHLLLGTTFNASNRAELERRSVTHILNVTREVDNFFPNDKYEYKNIRVFDDEQSSLLPYFEEIHRFINEAKAQGSACLVHCKMGISRSATAVIAYTMKEQNWDLETALSYVKRRRPCVQPNPGFMRELRTYQGILEASSNRHKPIFCHQHNSEPSPHIPRTNLISPHQPDCSPCSPELCTINAASRLTPTPRTSPPKRPSSAVDLEADLFVYKNASRSACSSPTSDIHFAEEEKVIEINRKAIPSDFVQNVVVEIRSPDRLSDKHAPYPVVLARNSHCLRQWHPSLAEKVNLDDGPLLVRKSVKSPQRTTSGELGTLDPVLLDRVSPLRLDIVKSQAALSDTSSIDEDHVVCGCSDEHQSVAESSVNPPAACSTTESMCAINGPVTTITICSATATNSSSPLFAVDPPLSTKPDVHDCPRQELYPAFVGRSNFSPTNLDNDTAKLYSSSFPSVLTIVSSSTPCTRSPEDSVDNVMVTLPSLDSSSYWQHRRHLVPTDCNVVDTQPSIFRSARNLQVSSCEHDRSNEFGRSISITHSIKSRLRPDDSWIVFPSSSEDNCQKSDEHLLLDQSPPNCSLKPESSGPELIRSFKDASGARSFENLNPNDFWAQSHRSYSAFSASPPRRSDFLSSDERTGCDLTIAQR